MKQEGAVTALEELVVPGGETGTSQTGQKAQRCLSLGEERGMLLQLGNCSICTDAALRGIFFFVFCLFAISWATSVAYGGSQARGLIGAVAAGLRQSHSHMGS